MKNFTRDKFLSLYLLIIAFFLIQAKAKFNPPPYYAPEKTIQLQGITLVYLDQGKGKPLLLIHGYCGNAYNWSDVFEEIAQDFRVIVPDLPGFGKSTCPAKEQKATVVWYADFLAEFLTEIKVEKAIVVGNSMGGAVAGWLALRHPEKVEKLVLVDSAGLKIPALDLLKFLAEITPSWMFVPLIQTIFPVNEKTLAKVPKSEQSRIMVAEERYDSELKLCSSRAMKWSALSIGKDLLEPELTKIQMPTLIIWGSNDDLLKVKHAYRFQQKIPQSELQIIEGGVHTPMQWKPEEFVKVLRDFALKN